MSAEPISRRLRDIPPGDTDASPQIRRAGEIIRAIDPPAPLGAVADMQVLAALRRRSSPSFRPRRWLLPAFTMLDIVGTGLVAAAAISWSRTPPSPPPVAEVAPVPTVAQKVREPVVTMVPAPELHEAPARSPTVRGGKGEFLRARLAINPKDRRYRPEIPPDFARAHAGQVFTWRVKICVSAAGTVTEATVLDPVHPLLDRQVVRAIQKWKYFPAEQGGHATNTCTALSYRLALEAPRAPAVAP